MSYPTYTTPSTTDSPSALESSYTDAFDTMYSSPPCSVYKEKTISGSPAAWKPTVMVSEGDLLPSPTYVLKSDYDKMVDRVNKLLSLIVSTLPPTKQSRILKEICPDEF